MQENVAVQNIKNLKSKYERDRNRRMCGGIEGSFKDLF